MAHVISPLANVNVPTLHTLQILDALAQHVKTWWVVLQTTQSAVSYQHLQQIPQLMLGRWQVGNVIASHFMKAINAKLHPPIPHVLYKIAVKMVAPRRAVAPQNVCAVAIFKAHVVRHVACAVSTVGLLLLDVVHVSAPLVMLGIRVNAVHSKLP